MMLLEGSCHCGAVAFTVEVPHPVPYMRCYCSICRKTAGAGGFAINLGARHDTLLVRGEDAISVYHAVLRDAHGKPCGHSEAGRRFCRHCGTALWLWDPRWPELVHPHAGAIDTPLPAPPSSVHIMLGSKPTWVSVDAHEQDRYFDAYPDESLAQWHERHDWHERPAPGDVPDDPAA